MFHRKHFRFRLLVLILALDEPVQLHMNSLCECNAAGWGSFSVVVVVLGRCGRVWRAELLL